MHSVKSVCILYSRCHRPRT